MSPRIILLASLVAGAVSLQCAKAGVTYDPATAFETGFLTNSNPNGVWSYGYSTTPTSLVTLYDAQTTGPDSPTEQFWISSTVNCCFASPAVGYNNGPAFDDGNVAAGAHQMILGSSVFQGLSTDLIFTAPAAGTYLISGSFIGDQRGINVGVDVVKNSGILFSSSVSSFGQVVPFGTTVLLNTDDIIEFAVTQGPGSQNTGLLATITSTSPIPEPASSLLFLTSLVGLIVARSRRLPGGGR